MKTITLPYEEYQELVDKAETNKDLISFRKNTFPREKWIEYQLQEIRKSLREKMEFLFEYDKEMLHKMYSHINQEYYRSLKVVDWETEDKQKFYGGIDRYLFTIPEKERPFLEMIATAFRNYCLKINKE